MIKFKMPRKMKKRLKKSYQYPFLCRTEKAQWEWFFFRKRVEVRCMEVILTYPKYDKEKKEYEFDPKLAVPATNEQLLEFYKKYYPDDKLSHHYCKQNRHRWDKFNNHV